ncbi:MAG: hypothetical protein SGJ04_04300 [Bacteroidota bacterium]|nr:hypothetical protein [Bacteroidota bacterium]
MRREAITGDKKKLPSLSRTSVLTFGVCVLVSFFLWLLFSLNDNYTHTIHIRIRYNNYNANYRYIDPLPQVITATVTARGWDFINENFTILQPEIKISVADFDKSEVISVQYIRTRIAQVLPNKVVIHDINPGSISLTKIKTKSKRVKIIPDFQVQLEAGYDFSDATIINPDSVSISGDAAVLSKVYFIKTEQLKGKTKGNRTFSDVELIEPTGNIILDKKTVTLKIFTDILTEKNLKVTTPVPNYPEQIIQIDNFYQTPLKWFNREDSKLFKYKFIKQNTGSGLNTFKIELESTPPFTYYHTYTPEIIELP